MTRPTGANSAIRILGAFVLVLGACGGGGTGDDADRATTTASGASPETTVQAAESATTSETAERPGTETSSAEPTTPDRSSGTVTVGGETYQFAVVDDGGSCNPDLFGIGFRAILTRVDEIGNPIERSGLAGFTEGVTFSLPFEADTGGVIGGHFAGTEWYAGEDDYEESTIDSVSIDGSRAEGTATFVNGSGEVVEGSFQVTCVEGSAQASGSGGDFCDDVAASIAMDEDLSLTDPELDEVLPSAVQQFDGLRARAPAAIAGDMDILYEALVSMNDLFAAHDYDMTAIPDDEMQQLASPEIEDASRNLAEYCDL